MASHSAKEKIATQLNDFQCPTNFPCKNLREHLISFLSFVFKNPTSKAVKSLTRWGHSIFFKARRQIKEMPSSFWAKFRPNYFFRFFFKVYSWRTPLFTRYKQPFIPENCTKKPKRRNKYGMKMVLATLWQKQRFQNQLSIFKKRTFFLKICQHLHDAHSQTWHARLHLSVFSWFMFLSNFIKSKMKIRNYFPKILCPWIMDY